MPRTLLLAPWYPPSPGGAETYAQRLFTHAPNFGRATSVATDGRAARRSGAPPTAGHNPESVCSQRAQRGFGSGGTTVTSASSVISQAKTAA